MTWPLLIPTLAAVAAAAWLPRHLAGPAAESARRAHYQRMALKSVQARRRRRGAQEED